MESNSPERALMEDYEYKALLYDFYGELLTDKQKEIYGLHVCEDYTAAEIAQQQGVSRQAAHDLLKRTHRLLIGYEEKLGLVEKFLDIKESVKGMLSCIEKEEMPQEERLDRLREAARRLLEII